MALLALAAAGHAQQGCAVSKDLVVRALELVSASPARDDLANGVLLLKQAEEACDENGDAWYYRSLFERKLGRASPQYSLGKARERNAPALEDAEDPFTLATPARGVAVVAHDNPAARSAPHPTRDYPSARRFAQMGAGGGSRPIPEFPAQSEIHAQRRPGDGRLAARSYYGRFRADHVRLIADSEATAVNIRAGLNWLARSATEDDMAVIYIATHGTAREQDAAGASYVVTYDTDVDSLDGLYSTAIPMVEITTVVRTRIKALKVAVILDTCHSQGAFAQTVTIPQSVSPQTLDRIREGTGRVILAASRTEESSYELAQVLPRPVHLLSVARPQTAEGYAARQDLPVGHGAGGQGSRGQRMEAASGLRLERGSRPYRARDRAARRRWVGSAGATPASSCPFGVRHRHLQRNVTHHLGGFRRGVEHVHGRGFFGHQKAIQNLQLAELVLQRGRVFLGNHDVAAAAQPQRLRGGLGAIHRGRHIHRRALQNPLLLPALALQAPHQAFDAGQSHAPHYREGHQRQVGHQRRIDHFRHDVHKRPKQRLPRVLGETGERCLPQATRQHERLRLLGRLQRYGGRRRPLRRQLAARCRGSRRLLLAAARTAGPLLPPLFDPLDPPDPLFDPGKMALKRRGRQRDHFAENRLRLPLLEVQVDPAGSEVLELLVVRRVQPHPHQLKIQLGVGERVHLLARDLVRGHQRALLRIVVQEQRLARQVGGLRAGRIASPGGYAAQDHAGRHAHVPDPEIHHILRRAGIGSLRKGLLAELCQPESGQRSSQSGNPCDSASSSTSSHVWAIIAFVALSSQYGFGPCRAFSVWACGRRFGHCMASRAAPSWWASIITTPIPPPGPNCCSDLKPPTVKRPAVEGDAIYWRFDDLDGAVNDVHLMKAVLQDLGFQDFVVLTDQDATADAILQALQKNLVDDAQPGDVRLFYYSGHGNHIKNRASTEREQEDQTLVPADNWRNVPDIRDKEISRILFNAARKGVIVTLIADSCHSGSLARGVWNSGGKARTNSGTRAGTPGVTLHEPMANDPADLDPATHQPIDPEMLGVLTLAAAQPNQEAREVQTEDGPHGAFTWALAQALRYASEPMERVFARTLAALGANGAVQLPAMGGPSRFSKTIFGQAPGAGGGLERGSRFGAGRRHPSARRHRHRSFPQMPPEDRPPACGDGRDPFLRGPGRLHRPCRGTRQRQGGRHPGARSLGTPRQIRSARCDSETGPGGHRGTRRRGVRQAAWRPRHRLARRPHRRHAHARGQLERHGLDARDQSSHRTRHSGGRTHCRRYQTSASAPSAPARALASHRQPAAGRSAGRSRPLSRGSDQHPSRRAVLVLGKDLHERPRVRVAAARFHHRRAGVCRCPFAAIG